MSNILVAITVIALAALLVWSILKGRSVAATERSDAVFGNPSRAEGGWYWVICGVSSVLLVWFIFSWDAARAFVPSAANEICQAAKVTSAGNPIRSRFAIEERLDRSTTVLTRDRRQLDALSANLAALDVDTEQRAQAEAIVDELRALMVGLAAPASVGADTQAAIADVADRLAALDGKLADPAYPGEPSADQRAAAEALPGWGKGKDEVPVDPASPAGYKLHAAAQELKAIAKDFARIRNTTPAFLAAVKDLDTRIKALESGAEGDFKRVVSNLKKLLKRIDDGAIFPAGSLAAIDQNIRAIDASTLEQLGAYRHVDNWLMPGGSILAGSTNCSEQGSGRWLPKPSDTLATLWQLAKPSEGYKGFPLLWYEWRQFGEVTELLFPDWIADLVPGAYPVADANGDITPNFKSKTLAFVTGDYQSFSLPVPMGHVWDSLMRVLAGLFFGIALGVPLGLFMGLSRFAKGYFDPLIELYRPVPPLAWAPLILTIFGIQDDGKIFLLFMVAFAIMVISARTGATGTKLSKIHAAHSLGATPWQILRNVIAPNSLPEILTGIRIAIGVCWGTLVAAEMLAGTTGIGFVENVARKQSDYEVIWVTIILLGLLGLLFDLGMRWVINRTIPWRGKG